MVKIKRTYIVVLLLIISILMIGIGIFLSINIVKKNNKNVYTESYNRKILNNFYTDDFKITKVIIEGEKGEYAINFKITNTSKHEIKNKYLKIYLYDSNEKIIGSSFIEIKKLKINAGFDSVIQISGPYNKTNSYKIETATDSEAKKFKKNSKS